MNYEHYVALAVPEIAAEHANNLLKELEEGEDQIGMLSAPYESDEGTWLVLCAAMLPNQFQAMPELTSKVGGIWTEIERRGEDRWEPVQDLNEWLEQNGLRVPSPPTPEESIAEWSTDPL